MLKCRKRGFSWRLKPKNSNAFSSTNEIKINPLAGQDCLIFATSRSCSFLTGCLIILFKRDCIGIDRVSPFPTYCPVIDHHLLLPGRSESTTCQRLLDPSNPIIQWLSCHSHHRQTDPFLFFCSISSLKKIDLLSNAQRIDGDLSLYILAREALQNDTRRAELGFLTLENGLRKFFSVKSGWIIFRIWASRRIAC